MRWRFVFRRSAKSQLCTSWRNLFLAWKGSKNAKLKTALHQWYVVVQTHLFLRLKNRLVHQSLFLSSKHETPYFLFMCTLLITNRKHTPMCCCSQEMKNYPYITRRCWWKVKGNWVATTTTMYLCSQLLLITFSRKAVSKLLLTFGTHQTCIPCVWIYLLPKVCCCRGLTKLN